MIINLAGTTFLDEAVKKKLIEGSIVMGDRISVKQENGTEESYDADYAIYAEDSRIGWIPQLHTITKYIVNELENNDRDKHDMQVRRYTLVSKIRGCITTDLHRNGITPEGYITNLIETDNGFSISVDIEH